MGQEEGDNIRIEIYLLLQTSIKPREYLDQEIYGFRINNSIFKFHP